MKTGLEGAVRTAALTSAFCFQIGFFVIFERRLLLPSLVLEKVIIHETNVNW
jgi:hypothetical protein